MHIPPRRERPEDIQLYLTQFIETLAKDHTLSITASGFEALLHHAGPGIVRELQQFVERAITLCDTGA